MRRDDATYAEIGRALGRTVVQVSGRFNNEGRRRPPMVHWTHWTDEMVNRAVQLRRDGSTFDEIARLLGLKRAQSVYTKLHQAGLLAAKRQNSNGAKASTCALADRDRRAEAATRRTQTQEFCGDPPPGYSALDQKQKQAGRG